MQWDIASFLVGLVVGVFITAALAFPRVGRIFARSAAIVLFVGGIGLIGWAAMALLRDSVLTPFQLGGVLVSQPAEAIGWGAGLLAGGILTLVLSSLRRS